MRVTIEVEFEVPEAESEDVARQAAEQAAWDYLVFCEISGYSRDTDVVTVHVDGHGEYQVRLAQ